MEENSFNHTIKIDNSNDELNYLKNELKKKNELLLSKEEKINSLKEIIKSKDEELISKENLIKQKDETIKSKEEVNVQLNKELIKLKNISNNSESKNIVKEFLNPKSVKMKFNGKEYILVCHKYYDKDKINGENTRLAIHYFNSIGSKFLFLKDKNDLYTIIFDNDDYNMFNWKMYSDGYNVQMSKELESKFQLLEIEGKRNHFYIRDELSGKFLCITKNKRDIMSYYIELADFDNLVEKDRFTFYI